MRFYINSGGRLLNKYTHYGLEDFDRFRRLKNEEKKKIRKVANLVGIVFIIVWILPTVLSGGLVDLTKIIFGDKIAASFFSDPAYLLLIQTILSIAMFTAPFLIIPLRTGKKRAELMSFEKPDKEKFIMMLFLGVGMSAFANIATSSVSAVFSSFGIEFLAPAYSYPKGFFGVILSVLAIAVTPALVEEFSMRGVVMGHLRECGDTFAVFMSAAIFAMIHGNFVQIPFAFLMGLIIGYAVIKTGSLITGVVIHFINNFGSVVMDMISDSVSSVFIKNSITAVYFAACFLCGFIGLYLARRQKREDWEMEKDDSILSLREKILYFFSAPAIIVSLGLTVVDSLQMIYIP